MTGHIEQIRHRSDQFSRGDIWGATEDWADGTPPSCPAGHHGLHPHLALARDQIVRFQLVTDTLQLARLLELATDEKGKADAIDNR